VVDAVYVDPVYVILVGIFGANSRAAAHQGNRGGFLALPWMNVPVTTVWVVFAMTIKLLEHVVHLV